MSVIRRPSSKLRSVRLPSLLKIGVIGSVIAALCCFTPMLVLLLGVVGLSAFTRYLDYVLFPALGLFFLLKLYALWQRADKS